MAMTGGQGYCVVDETSTSGNRVRLYIYVKEKSQNTSTNSTILQLGMYVNSTYAIGPWNKSSNSYIGTATSGSNCYTFDGSIGEGSGTRWLIENKEVTVKHDSDGTKSVKIYWKWGINAYTSYISGYQNPSSSKTVTLTTIPQASTITSANDVTLNGSDQTCTVKVSRKSSSFYHKAKITCGDKSTTSGAFTTSVNITIPNSWLSEFPNATYKKATVTLTTYTSSACTTKVGSTDSTTIKITAGNSIKPSATKLTASIVNGINRYYVKGISSVKLTTSGAQAGTGSSIASYIFTGQNISGSSSTYTGTSSTKTSSIIQSAGNLSYSVQVKDTRGRLSDKKTANINVIDYTLPAITSLKVGRVDGDDTRATVTVKITYKNITIGSTVNEPVLTLKKGSENAAAILSESEPESTSTNSTTNIVTNTYKYTYTGLAETDKPTITATLYDMICGSDNAVTKTVNLSSASRTLNIAKYGNGVAIGQMSTVTSSTAAGKFECNWPASFSQYISLKGTIYSNGKTEAYDGSRGVAVGSNGRIYLTGGGTNNSAGETSGFVFVYDKGTKATSTIFETASGVITVSGTLNATLQNGSDERMKKDFGNLDKFEKFYDNLNPCCFRMKTDDERYHIGFIAQQVEQSLNNNGLTKDDFGALNISPYEGDIDESSNDGVGRYKNTGIEQGEDSYGLIYSEFIALNTYMIQKLKSENEELKNRVSLLEEKLASAITEIENLKESIKNEA